MSEPRSEPEIIPPGRHDGRRDSVRERPDPWASANPYGNQRIYGTQRIFVGRVGPLGILLLALVIGVLAAVVFIVLLGAFLLWIPLAILLLFAFIAASILRRSLRRR